MTQIKGGGRVSPAKKYVSLFRIRLTNGLQYRAAALAGCGTQFFWGFMDILLFKAFYTYAPQDFPMEFSALVNYLWLQQAFLSIFALWIWDRDILDCITSGNIAYELTRPMSLYTFWYLKTVSSRIAKAALRCLPILLVAALLPEPYRLTAPASTTAFFGFVLTAVLGLLVISSIMLIIYALNILAVSPHGVNQIFVAVAELFCGQVLPLPFFPDTLRKILSFTPFAVIQNVPLRIYSGDIAGKEMLFMLAMQIFWLAVLVLCGRLLIEKVLRRAVIQGG